MKSLLVSIFLVATAFLFSSYLQNPKAESIKRGKEVYKVNCQGCHMENGEGIEESFPPLAKADYLMKDPRRAITIILKGQHEEISVNGKKYHALMPEQSYLSDEEIADVVNYIANSWGNSYKVLISPAMVKAGRNQ